MTGTVIIDPPWPYTDASNDSRLSGYSSHEYPSMSIDQLQSIPIINLADYLFLWTTVAFIEQSYKLVRGWGFRPITMLFWIKASQIHFPSGMSPKGSNFFQFRPTYGVGYWFRGAVEPIIVAKRPKVRSIRTEWLGLISENALHSKKPDSLHILIEKNFPKPYIELFARTRRPNWFCMGESLRYKDIMHEVEEYIKEGVQ